MAIDVEAASRELRSALSRGATRERAAGAKKYLKSTLTFLGANVPAIRREAKAFVRSHPDLTGRDLEALSRRLWDSDVHELRSVAIGILELAGAVLRARDAKWLIALVRRADTWAHVDWLSVKVMGPLVEREPRLQKSLDAWAHDPNFWVRRTALLAFHDALAAGRGDFEHFERIAAPLLTEREFFIRKAIGWVLRATVRRGPERAVGFVERHAREMSPLTFREATRNLPPPEQRRLRALRDAPMQARRATRPRVAKRRSVVGAGRYRSLQASKRRVRSRLR